MDIEDYRGLQQRIRLTGNGQVPTRGLTRFEEKESALARIDRTWRLIERFPKNDAQEETLVIAKDKAPIADQLNQAGSAPAIVSSTRDCLITGFTRQR